MIILVDPKNSEVRIELRGQFAEQDRDTLLREFPELREMKIETVEGQLDFFKEIESDKD